MAYGLDSLLPVSPQCWEQVLRSCPFAYVDSPFTTGPTANAVLVIFPGRVQEE